MSAQDSKIRRPNLISIRSLFIITLFYCLRSTRLVFAKGEEESFCEKRLKEYYEDRHDYGKQCILKSGSESSSCCKLIKESLEDRVRQYRILCPESVILGPNEDGQCNNKTDIIFVLDRSGSIRPSDFWKMREFLKFISKLLQIGVRNKQGKIISQGAIVTFSEKGAARITLKESRTPGKFDDIVNRMPCPLPGGRTKTHLGLAVADKDVVQNKYGLRDDDPEVKKILMVITDDEQTRGGRGFVPIRDAIKPFFDRDMDVFAIGVGLHSQSAKDQILDMVEVRENAIFPKSYTELMKAVAKYFIKYFCGVSLKPQFAIFPPSNVKTRGEDEAYWEYEVIGFPRPSVTWYIVRDDKKEERLAECGESGVCNILIADYLHLDIDDIFFTIKQPSFRKDNAKFKCVAGNLLGIATKEFRVTVEAYKYTCGGKDYNPLDKVCCQGKLQYVMESTGSWKCCGKNYYNDSYIASKDIKCP